MNISQNHIIARSTRTFSGVCTFLKILENLNGPLTYFAAYYGNLQVQIVRLCRIYVNCTMCGEASFKVAAAAFDSLGFVFLPQDFELDSPTPSQKNMTLFCEV